jgi:hypothetical protein
LRVFCQNGKKIILGLKNRTLLIDTICHSTVNFQVNRTNPFGCSLCISQVGSDAHHIENMQSALSLLRFGVTGDDALDSRLLAIGGKAFRSSPQRTVDVPWTSAMGQPFLEGWHNAVRITEVPGSWVSVGENNPSHELTSGQ